MFRGVGKQNSEEMGLKGGSVGLVHKTEGVVTDQGGGVGVGRGVFVVT